MNRARALSAARRLDPRQESGTFRSLVAGTDDPPEYLDVTLARMGRRQPTQEEIKATSFKGDEQVAVWCVLDEEVVGAAVVPKLNDLIVDAAGLVWIVKKVEALLLATRYHCTCVRVWNPE